MRQRPSTSAFGSLLPRATRERVNFDPQPKSRGLSLRCVSVSAYDHRVSRDDGDKGPRAAVGFSGRPDWYLVYARPGAFGSNR